MSYKKDFDVGFGIMDVAMALGLSIKRKSAYVNSIDACCPFCNDTKFHMNLNLKKDVYRCNRCDSSGGMIQLYANLKGVDSKTAFRELAEIMNLPESSPVRERAKLVTKKTVFVEEALPDFEKINLVYRAMFEEIDLLPKHKENLLNRGLPESEIEKNMYRSVPDRSKEYQIADVLLKKCSLDDLSGVPGFFKDRVGKWKANFSNEGFFIPVRDMNKKIIGAQIRTDAGDPKYISFSSAGLKMGTKSITSVHCVGNFKNPPETVYVTEGPLKADIANYFTGYTFLAVPGVNNQKYLIRLLERLKSMGVKTVTECFDMDKREKKEVSKALDKLENSIKEIGLNFNPTAWNPNYKGIDDYLLYRSYRSSMKMMASRA